MTNLTDTQPAILTAACQRLDQLALPLPAHLKGGAADKVVRALLAKGLLEEVAAGRDVPVWREADDGRKVTLVATDAARAALGIEQDSAPERAPEAPSASQANEDGGEPAKALAARIPAPARKTRDGTKKAQLIAMLERAEGATLAEIVEVTGWQQHYADTRIMPM